MSKKNNTTSAGRISISDLITGINKKSGRSVAHSLKGDNPTEVKQWIPTGSRWLDSMICKGKYAGIPVGKITEIAGLEATGKSYMAAKIAANAQKMDLLPVYFDSESAIDPTFLERAGCDLENLIYIQASNVEFVLETMEHLLDASDKKLLFIWDSLAFTPSVTDVEGNFDPQSSIATKARILAKGVSKLTIPIADKQATWLVLNQLKTNITRTPAEAMTTPYVTPGGKAMSYAYSLRIWLTGRKAKGSYVYNDSGFRIGSEVKVKLEKSRFGTQGRTCNFTILWGTEHVGVQDEQSWLDALKESKHMIVKGSWYTLSLDGYEKKFQPSRWVEVLNSDEEFKNKVIELMDIEVIQKFDSLEGNASMFYDSDGENDSNNENGSEE